jgi:POT family proton-dependent oligopeptide transporter
MSQPKALYFLFAIELWERFGFYVMRSLLVLYLVNVFHFNDSKSYLLFGSFTALIWFTPVIGGYIADKVLGYQRALIIGAVAFILGYGLLALPSTHAFFWGLSLILVGNGFFKPNVAGLLGSLYDGPNDPRREGGFTIYYMGINVGALLAALFAGGIAEKFGWNAAFGCSAIGLFFGLLTFLWGRKMLGERGLATAEHLRKQKSPLGINYESLVYIGIVALVVVGYFLMRQVHATNLLLAVFGGVLVTLFIYTSLRRTKEERNRMLACLVLIIFSIVFWTLYQQAPMSVNLFTERNLDRHFFDWVIPTASYQSLNPFFIIACTPLMNGLWKRANRNGKMFPIALKFVIGTALMGLGFLVLNWAAKWFATNGIVSSWWVILSYGLQSIGELALQPVGLAAMTALAPRNMVAIMLGMWFYASAVANALSGWLGQMASVPQNDMSPRASIHIYAHAFAQFGWWTVGIAFIGLLFVPKLSKMMGER